MVVLRHPLGRWVDPAAAFAALYVDAPAAFWLDSGDTGVSYLGAGSRSIHSLGELRAELAAGAAVADSAGEADADDVAFALGWVGWLGYELRGETMQEPLAREPAGPPLSLMFVDRALAFDHDRREVWLLTLGELPEWRVEVATALEVGAAIEPDPMASAVRSRGLTASWRYSDDDYLGMIRACQAAITAGDAYQLCLTSEARVDASPDPFDTYLALRASSPTHHGGLVIMDGVALLSASPEQFLAVSPSGVVSSSPIKGTRPRSTDAVADAALSAELVASDKERAENLMIVDLVRNDIARIADVGTVAVPSLLRVESYAHVHQLVSTVRGQLALGLSAVDAVVATFPAGSMTGAPKLSAMRILDRLEARDRGIYSGVFGYFSLDGSVDLAMVIRSIVIDADGSTIGAGGGITALSVPAEELAEVKLKAAALLAVLGAR